MRLRPALLLAIPALALALTTGGASTPRLTRHRVDLAGNRFLPRQLRIQVGDTVEFLNGQGGPHNVAFWPDSLPADARVPLAAALPDSIAPLVGSLLFEPEQTWTMSFAGVPAGRYPYYCLPHLAGGMVGEILVSSER